MAKYNKKVAILFNKPGVFPGLEDVVSAHIQLPVHTSVLLTERGIDNLLISTEVPENQVLPNLFKKVNKDQLVLVPDPNKQGSRSVVVDGHIKGVDGFKLLKYAVSIIAVLFKRRVSVLHVFGTEKYAIFAVLFKVFLPWMRIVWTTENFKEHRSWPKRLLLKISISRILTTTEFVRSKYEFVSDTFLARAGIVRRFEVAKNDNRNRVLFWRDPSRENGADIAFSVFKQLSARYPDVVFTFAVRPHWDPVVEPEDCSEFQNIEMHVLPYKNGVTIEKLLSEAICVLFPFRELSTNPQLALVETLYAGVPVVCSNVESNQELLNLVGMDYGLTDDVDAYAKRLADILDAYFEKGELWTATRQQMDAEYSWDKFTDACIDSYR